MNSLLPAVQVNVEGFKKHMETPGVSAVQFAPTQGASSAPAYAALSPTTAKQRLDAELDTVFSEMVQLSVDPVYDLPSPLSKYKAPSDASLEF